MRDSRKSGVRGADTQLRFDLPRHSRCEFWTGDLVDRHDDRAAQQAAEKCHNPLGAVLSPDENLVAFADVAYFECLRKPVCILQHLAVTPAMYAVASAENVGRFSGMSAKVVEVFQDAGACHRSTV